MGQIQPLKGASMPSNENATRLIINPFWLSKFYCCLAFKIHSAFASSLILFWIFKFLLLSLSVTISLSMIVFMTLKASSNHHLLVFLIKLVL